MVIKSHAKINLTLDVLGKDGDYHFVDTVICEVPDLFDEIEIIPADKLKVEMHGVAQEENLAYKAAKLLEAKAHIRIKKNIPISSGLGGGSSNAATVLRAFGGDRSQEELLKLAVQIGMDVPFFIVGGVCFCTHYGEIVEPIATDLELRPKIIFSKNLQPTSDAYGRLHLTKTGKNREKTTHLIKALKQNNLQGVIENLHNDFDQLQAANCKPQAILSGSGPARFILSTSK